MRAVLLERLQYGWDPGPCNGGRKVRVRRKPSHGDHVPCLLPNWQKETVGKRQHMREDTWHILDELLQGLAIDRVCEPLSEQNNILEHSPLVVYSHLCA
jgi:hypothetical protein